MRTLYFDCSMGAAGDMLMAALLELHPQPEDFLRRLNSALAGRAVVSAAPDKKCGVKGTHVSVVIDGTEEDEALHSHHHGEAQRRHHHTGLRTILDLIESTELPEMVKRDAAKVYRILAEAESRVHGEPVDQIHFHEVGSLDALADVLGVCMLMEELKPECVCASPIHVGSGTVRCAHGILPVPAPATELILRGVPIYTGEIAGELCTPTAAALLKHYARRFGAMPVLCVEKTGYGTGKKDFPQANVVRAFLGETDGQPE